MNTQSIWLPYHNQYYNQSSKKPLSSYNAKRKRNSYQVQLILFITLLGLCLCFLSSFYLIKTKYYTLWQSDLKSNLKIPKRYETRISL